VVKKSVSDDLISEASKFNNGEDFYQRVNSEVRNKLKEQ
jgi:hypothetical protein